MAVHESPGAGRVLIALADGPLVAEPTWTRFDTEGSGFLGFDWNRGRQSEFDVTNTGTARVFFQDQAGAFDSEDLIGLQIMLQLFDPVVEAWEPVFRGHVDDLPSVPSPGAPDLTSVQIDCVDVFDYLAGVKLVPGEFGDVVPAGVTAPVFYEDGPVDDRITTLLDDAGLDTDMYVVFSGNVDVIESRGDIDDDVLSFVRNAADAEFVGIANVYPDRYGRVVFHGRFARFDPDTVSADAGDAAWDFQRWEAATRADVGTTRAQVREFSYNRPRTRIVNSFLAWPERNPDHTLFDQADVPALKRTDPASITAYGYRGREASALIIKEHKTNGNTGAQECGLVGDFWVGNYSVPRKNVQRVTFRTLRPENSRATPNWALITRIDISDIVELTIAEAGLSGAEFYVEGINGSMRVAAPEYDWVEVTPNLSPAAYYLDNVFEGS